MSLSNCKKCGKLFVKKNRDICDECYNNQIKLIDRINEFVINKDQNVSLEEILQKFDIPLKEFETLFTSGKFIQITDKLVLKCIRCGKAFVAGRNVGFVCPECLKKLKI